MDRRNHLLTPLIIAAAASVITFAGIGIAAITGHLSMNQMSPNPLAGLAGASRPAPAVVAPGKARAPAAKARPGTRPIDFRPGSRVAAGRAKCGDCGVVDSIRAKEVDAGAPSREMQFAAISRVSDTRVAVNFVVTLRMEDGTVRTIYENQRPPFSIGERVRLVNGSVVPFG